MGLSERITPRPLLPEPFEQWFAARGWTPRTHQLDLLAKARAGRSALLIAPTGAGKTLAGFLPTLVELYEQRSASPRAQSAPSPRIPGLPAIRIFVRKSGRHDLRRGGSGRGVRSKLRVRKFTPLATVADLVRNCRPPPQGGR